MNLETNLCYNEFDSLQTFQWRIWNKWFAINFCISSSSAQPEGIFSLLMKLSEDRRRLSVSFVGGLLVVKYNFGIRFENVLRLVESDTTTLRKVLLLRNIYVDIFFIIIFKVLLFLFTLAFIYLMKRICLKWIFLR